MTRDNKLVWPQKWLPEDLGAGNIRVLSVSFDADSNVSNNYNRHELGKNLVQKLVLRYSSELLRSPVLCNNATYSTTFQRLFS
jgi:hypothetical protein